MPILDNFDSQFINDASELENGLMSSHDKIKLDNILLSDIDYISDGLKDIEEYTKPRFIYGIKIDTTNSNSNDCVTYTDDAATFTPLKVNQDTGECNYGSWKEIIDTLIGAKPCLVKTNGEVLFNLNPDNYNKLETGETIDIESGEFGQVMIRFNHLYYKFSMEDNYIKFQISNKKVDNTWIDTAFVSEDGIGQSKDYMFISAYEVGQKDNKLQSLSNVSPSFRLLYKDIERLTEFGVFHMMNIIKKQFIVFLGYLVTKSIDLVGNIGIGNIDGEVLKTGTMNDKGLFYGKKSNNITFTQSNITSGDFNCVYYANSIWVAGNSSTGLYYSTDGKTWTQSNITSDTVNCVYNANGIWVAGNSSTGAYYSLDGKTWTQSNITSGDFNCVYNANGIWVAGGKGLYYSTDGKTWTQSNITSGSFKCVYNANGIWVAGSWGNGLYYGIDPIIINMNQIINNDPRTSFS